MNLFSQALLERMHEAVARFDANESTFFLRDLEQKLAKEIDQPYAELKARQFVPKSPESINPGAEVFSSKIYDGVTGAAVIYGAANDFPRVDLKTTEEFHTLRMIGNAFGWNYQELLRQAFSRSNTNAKKARWSRFGIERYIDAIISFGLPLHGIYGFLNNPNVTASDVATVSSAKTWAAKSAANNQSIVDDITEMLNTMASSTVEIETAPDTLLLPPSALRFLQQTEFRTNYPKKLIDVVREAVPTITTIDSWIRLETAGASSSRRMVMYKKDTDHLYYVVAQEYTPHPAWQDSPVSWAIPATAVVGGTVIDRPLGISYRDAF